MGLEVGTKRYSPEWLRDRLKWRDDEGVPIQAGCLRMTKTSEDEKKPEIDDAIAEDLELELQNSLSLRIHPALRRAQLRRIGTAEYQRKRHICCRGSGQDMQKSG